jgi:hypothetical protein
VTILVGQYCKFGDKHLVWDRTPNNPDCLRVDSIPVPIVAFRNYGRTAAIVTRAFVSFEPLQCEDYRPHSHALHDGLENRLLMEPLENQGVVPDGTLEFKALTKLREGIEVSESLRNELSSLKATLVCYGKIEYRSVLYVEPRYVTYFCWLLDYMVADGDFSWEVGPLSHNSHT